MGAIIAAIAGAIALFVQIVGLTLGTTSEITSNQWEEDVGDKEQLIHFIQVNYHNIAKEAASGCGEYVNALYTEYIEAFEHNVTLYAEDDAYDETLTKEYFCVVIRKDYEIIFINSEYDDDFLPILENRINLASHMQ